MLITQLGEDSMSWSRGGNPHYGDAVARDSDKDTLKDRNGLYSDI